MNSRNIIISIALVSILAGGVAWYFYKKTTVVTPPTEEFPGESRDRSKTPTGKGGTQADDEITPFVPGTSAVPPRLYELHKTPVAGVGFFETKDKKGSVTSVTARYIERGLGHIFETPLSTYKEARIVNETRPSISEAHFGNSGKSVVVRFIDDSEVEFIKTQIINIGSSPVSFSRSTSTESNLDVFMKTEVDYLPDYIPFMATAGDGTDKLFYLEGGTGSTATFKNSGVSKVFTSSFTEWLPQFPNQKLVTLTTRPSEKVLGYMFFLNPSTKSVTKILDGINGLTTLTNPNGKFVLYSETKGGGPVVSFYDTTKKLVYPLSIQTLPEKCVWSTKTPTLAYCAVPQTIPNASYPDQWYQGLVQFSDSLWEIDAVKNSARKIMETKPLGAPIIDMVNLSLSSDGSYLLFMNKITSTPWVYSTIEQPTQRSTATSTVSLPSKPMNTIVAEEGMRRIK